MILNFADIYADLWPEDDTPRILSRVLVHYNYAAGIRGSEGDRCKFIVEFCDTVLRDNASRALVKDPPLAFRRTKEKWSDLAEKYPTAPSAASFQDGKGNSAGSNRGRGGGNSGSSPTRGGAGGGGGRGGNQFKGKVARFFSAGVAYPVCFDFNRQGGCTKRTAKGCGCDDGRGGVYAHVCNFMDTSSGKWCLAQHGRIGNH